MTTALPLSPPRSASSASQVSTGCSRERTPGRAPREASTWTATRSASGSAPAAVPGPPVPRWRRKARRTPSAAQTPWPLPEATLTRTRTVPCARRSGRTGPERRGSASRRMPPSPGSWPITPRTKRSTGTVGSVSACAIRSPRSCRTSWTSPRSRSSDPQWCPACSCRIRSPAPAVSRLRCRGWRWTSRRSAPSPSSSAAPPTRSRRPAACRPVSQWISRTARTATPPPCGAR